MHRLIWLVLAVSLANCGGGDKSAATLTVRCAGGVQLVGAASVDVLGDLDNGRTTMKFPDPANSGKIGTITVQPHDHCKVTPGSGSG